jgi:large subunit ribosomal protein L20
MSRVKRGKIATKKRKKILKYTKGFRWGRKTKERAEKEALLHAWTHAYQGRKQKKRDYRALWNVRINAAARANGMKYSELVNRLKKANIKLDRKMLADLARNEPKVFEKVLAAVK